MKKIAIVVFALSVILLIIVINRRGSLETIDPLKYYALNFDPEQDARFANRTNVSNFKYCCPTTPPENVVEVLNKSLVTMDFKSYTLLIYLKVYYYQLITYRQSFEVREAPFFLKRFGDKSALNRAYCEIVGRNIYEKKFGPEFLPAYEAMNYVEKNEIFKKNEFIAGELHKINSILMSMKY